MTVHEESKRLAREHNEGLKQLIPELNFTPDYLRVWNEIKRVEKFIKKYQ
jgi:hypothetical protein